MTYVVKPEGYHWLAQVFDDLFNELSKREHQGTQKAQARHEGWQAGLMHATAQVLVAVGTEQRLARIKNLLGDCAPEHVEMVDYFLMQDWIRNEGKKFLEGEARHTESGWAEYISEAFAEMVWPDTLIHATWAVRKERILEGKLKPDSRDAEWLEEHVKSLTPAMNKASELLVQAQKAGK